MPTDIITNEESIYDQIVVIAVNKNDYKVYNLKTKSTLQFGIKDVETALQIKKAYCDGYYDGAHPEVERIM